LFLKFVRSINSRFFTHSSTPTPPLAAFLGTLQGGENPLLSFQFACDHLLGFLQGFSGKLPGKSDPKTYVQKKSGEGKMVMIFNGKSSKDILFSPKSW